MSRTRSQISSKKGAESARAILRLECRANTQDKHGKRVAVLGEGVVQGEGRGRERRNGRGIVPSFLMKVDWAEGQPLPLEDAHPTCCCAIGSGSPGCSCLHLVRLSIAPFPILFPQILTQERTFF